MNLMPCGSGVLELMPLQPGSLEPTEPHWHMLYLQAAFLEMRYWMLPIPAAEGNRDDMVVPLEDLRAIVDALLELPPGEEGGGAGAAGAHAPPQQPASPAANPAAAPAPLAGALDAPGAEGDE